MKKQTYLVLFFVFFITPIKTNEWTWLYRKMFSQAEIDAHKFRQALLFTKKNTPQFTQLIFSWNAFRPENGFFRFQARVRDAKTKKWHKWHKMMEWGNAVQCSFIDKTLFGTQYHYVRLEVPKGTFADAISVKVEGCEGADCSLLRGLYVNLSNFLNFKPESVGALNLSSLHIRKVPEYSQMVLDHPKKEALCSPTACTMVVNYLTRKKVCPVDFAQSAHDKGLDAFGSWPFNMAHAFERCNGSHGFRVQRLSSFSALHKYLQKILPVVVSVRGTIEGAPKDYNDGHLLVVVGWDAQNKKVICHDPAFDTNNKTCISYNINSFLKAWECSRRLAYVAEPYK